MRLSPGSGAVDVDVINQTKETLYLYSPGDDVFAVEPSEDGAETTVQMLPDANGNLGIRIARNGERKQHNQIAQHKEADEFPARKVLTDFEHLNPKAFVQVVVRNGQTVPKLVLANTPTMAFLFLNQADVQVAINLGKQTVVETVPTQKVIQGGNPQVVSQLPNFFPYQVSAVITLDPENVDRTVTVLSATHSVVGQEVVNNRLILQVAPRDANESGESSKLIIPAADVPFFKTADETALDVLGVVIKQ